MLQTSNLAVKCQVLNLRVDRSRDCAYCLLATVPGLGPSPQSYTTKMADALDEEWWLEEKEGKKPGILNAN